MFCYDTAAACLNLNLTLFKLNPLLLLREFKMFVSNTHLLYELYTGIHLVNSSQNGCK